MSVFRTIAAALAIALPVMAFMSPKAASASPWDKDWFPNHPVTSQNGDVFAFYDDLVRDKIVITNFIYTTCEDICGLATARLSWIKDELGDRVGKDIFVYSISLTPEYDTPERLKAFSEAFEPGEGWLFLTGKKEHIDEIRYKLGERSRLLSEHRSDMAIGNDRTGRWRRISVMGNLSIVADQILRLDPNFKPDVKNASVGATATPIIVNTPGTKYDTFGKPGEALFQKACSACHTVGGGKRVGPDLHAVTLRRDRAWLFRAIMEPELLRHEKDPQMVALDAQFPGVIMPNLDLSKDDARDVLLYLAERTVAINEKRQAAAGGDGDEHKGHAGHGQHHPKPESAKEAKNEVDKGTLHAKHDHKH